MFRLVFPNRFNVDWFIFKYNIMNINNMRIRLYDETISLFCRLIIDQFIFKCTCIHLQQIASKCTQVILAITINTYLPDQISLSLNLIMSKYLQYCILIIEFRSNFHSELYHQKWNQKGRCTADERALT